MSTMSEKKEIQYIKKKKEKKKGYFLKLRDKYCYFLLKAN